MSSLSFEPLISPALWVLLTVAALALPAWYSRRRPAAISRARWAAVLVLQLLALAAVFVVLLNPTWVVPVRAPAGKPSLTILVDETASMTTPDGTESLTRFQAAARTAAECIDKLQDRFDIQLLTCGTIPKRADVKSLANAVPTSQSTDLAAAILAGVEQDRPQGQAVVLLSDGIHNAGGTSRVIDAARVAKAMACPVFTLTFGGNTSVKDLAVDLRSSQEIAFIGQKLEVPVLIRQRGLKGGQATVTFSSDGKELDRRTVPLKDEDPAEVKFTVTQPKTGLYRYEVAVEPLAEEVTRTNNTATLVLRVVDKPVRMLVLEGRPYWDGKFLVRTLQTDSSVEVDSVVRVGENRFIHRSLSRPPSQEAGAPGKARDESQVLADISSVLAPSNELRAYQVIVLGRDTDSFLTEDMLNHLQTWLSRDGGSLVCYRGPPASPVSQRLSRLLPVRWAPGTESRLSLSPTVRGRELGWFPHSGSKSDALYQLPTLAMTARPEQPRPLAVVLATTGPRGDEPAVSYQTYGTGRVVVVEGSGMWRWAFLPPAQQQLDEVYRSLWHGLIRWMVSSSDLLPGQKYALRSEKSLFQPNDLAAATLLLGEAAIKEKLPAIELRGETLKEARTIAPIALGDDPRAFRVVFGTLPEGHYEARVAGVAAEDGSSTAFEVRNFSDEMLDLTARPDLMARIAEESDGTVLHPDYGRGVADAIGDEWERTRSRQVLRITAWDRWWILLSVVALWTTAWILRRSRGLV